ncbi:phospholipase D-like domain-containing protein [Uliginosibacterium sp. H1]|uniref:phospholipase D-like domain-containing protein n=1 Tax=Uliginosibacterium sp. H1 TaxID=3114757 RepID=UPI002E18199D|nr:phospholipase D-like domain-containing protein [Uliginosibacterium sp. H1]
MEQGISTTVVRQLRLGVASLGARLAWLLRCGLLFILSLSGAACQTLPEVPLQAAQASTGAATGGAAHPPVLVADRQASAGQAQRVVSQLKVEGRPRLLERQLQAMADSPNPLIAGNAVDLLIDGPATYKAMFAAVEKARRSIVLESYIIEDAEISQRLADLLLRKRQQGVRVNIIYDGIGSLTTSAEFFQRLRDGGVAVCEFNPVHPARPLHLLKVNHRDHRKILVVDGSTAFTGGINISSVYSSGSSSIGRRNRGSSGLGSGGSGDKEGREPTKDDGWRDTQVAVRGPAATAFNNMFAETWRQQKCAGAAPLSEAVAAPAGDKVVQVIASGPSEQEVAAIYKAYIGAIDASLESVLITMAYFAPDDRTMAALKTAAQRGVKVRMILPGFSDSGLILHAGRAHYSALLEAGVEIYERHDALLHAKTAVVDGVWSTVGSTNLDWRSFLHNNEVNAVVMGEEFGSAMRAQFERDLDGAKRITLDAWRDRGVMPRMKETFSRMWEYLL